MTHEILEEVWRNRDEFAKSYNYSLDAIVAVLREIEHQPGSVVVIREGIALNEPSPQEHHALTET